MSETTPEREPSAIERHVFSVLTQVDFPGNAELRAALQHVKVKTIDENGSLRIIPRGDITLSTVKQIPVEAEAVDADGIIVHVLLHVKNHAPSELEIFKEDGSPLSSLEALQTISAFALPPHPSERA